MTRENKIALQQIQSMLKTGALHGGTIRQRAQFVVAIESAIPEPAFSLDEIKDCALAMVNFGDRTCEVSPKEYFKQTFGIDL